MAATAAALTTITVNNNDKKIITKRQSGAVQLASNNGFMLPRPRFEAIFEPGPGRAGPDWIGLCSKSWPATGLALAGRWSQICCVDLVLTIDGSCDHRRGRRRRHCTRRSGPNKGMDRDDPS